MKLSDDIFLFFHKNELVLWDYRNNNQYIVTNEYFHKLNKFAKDGSIDDETLSEFHSLGLIDCKPAQEDWGWDKLSKIFHVGTTPNLEHKNVSPEEAARSFIDTCKELKGSPIFFKEKDGKIINLPKSNFGKTRDISLHEVLSNRRTIRNFCKKSTIKLSYLSDILFICFGKQNSNNDIYHYLRTSSSGGGLHPTEPYIIVNRVKGLERGIYYYHSAEHTLTRINDYPDSLGTSLMHQYFAEDASCGIILASNFEREQWKYQHSRAYRVCLLDAGHLSQTVQLTCNAYVFRLGLVVHSMIMKLIN